VVDGCGRECFVVVDGRGCRVVFGVGEVLMWCCCVRRCYGGLYW